MTSPIEGQASGGTFAMRATLPVSWEASLGILPNDHGIVTNDFLVAVSSEDPGHWQLRFCGMELPETRPSLRSDEAVLFEPDLAPFDAHLLPAIDVRAERRGESWVTDWVGVEVGIELSDPTAVAWPMLVDDLGAGQTTTHLGADLEPGLRMRAADRDGFRPPAAGLGRNPVRIGEMHMAVRNVLRFTVDLPDAGEGGGRVEPRPVEAPHAGRHVEACLNALTLSALTAEGEACGPEVVERINLARPTLLAAPGEVRTLPLPSGADCSAARRLLGAP